MPSRESPSNPPAGGGGRRAPSPVTVDPHRIADAVIPAPPIPTPNPAMPDIAVGVAEAGGGAARGTAEAGGGVVDPADRSTGLPSATEQMTRPERVFFAAGDIFGGGGAALISVLYLFYLADVVGIPPAWAGFAVLIPRLWDAINDPLMGLLSDNTRTRWGRRRPFITTGAILLTVALAAIWAPIGSWDSTPAKVAFVVAANLFYTTVSTMIAVPYGSLSTEVTTNYQERNRINVMRLAFSTIAAATCTVIGTTLIQLYTRGQLTEMQLYLLVVFGFGLLFATPLLIAMKLTRERTPIPQERTRLSIASAVAPLKLESFRKLLGMYLSQALTMDVISALIVFYAIYVVQMNVTIFLGIFIV
nr:MFS transporter [Actinomycetales bacterium]